MSKLWKTDYKLNLLEIDAQHKKFFEMLESGEELAAKVSPGPKDIYAMFQLILAFRTYGYLHFYTEEALMIQRNYPYFLEHLETHDSFITAMNKYRKGFLGLYKASLAGADNLAEIQKYFQGFASFTLAWYQRHITTEDAKYAHYLRRT